MTFAVELMALFRRDLARLIQELQAFEDESRLWETSAGMTNPPGNLMLHLEGNLREYIGRQLGDIAYSRNRALEFSSEGIPASELLTRLQYVQNMVPQVIASLAEHRWTEPYPDNVLGTPMSTRQFLTHCLAHLNYHLGQIDCARRMLTRKGAISLQDLSF